MDINLEFIKNEYFLRKVEDYLNHLFQIKKEIIGLILFGSIARGEETYSKDKRSDIDLIIIFRDNSFH